MIFIPFCLSAEQKKNRVDLVGLIRLSSVTKLNEKFQFDYVLLPNQSRNNPTGSISYTGINTRKSIKKNYVIARDQNVINIARDFNHRGK